MTKLREVWVGGYPSFYGGADTELDHNIDLWRQNDVEVNLVPLPGCNPQMRALCDERGCRTHEFHPAIFRDKVVVSYCNGEFLTHLPQIIEQGRPAELVWFNCMTWTFEKEIAAHRHGWIDRFGFVSAFQERLLRPQLERERPVTAFEGYRPFFSPANRSQQVSFAYRRPGDCFNVGRISRDDSNKFSSDMWRIFDKVCTPRAKKVFVLGYGPNARGRTGPAPAGLDHQTWEPNEVPVRQFYETVHCIIHKTGGSRESYCRIVPEAYGSGVPMIVEDDYAFPELVVDGVTGFRCQSSDEMSYRASQLAFDETLRKSILENAYQHLVHEIAAPARCWQPWRALLA